MDDATAGDDDDDARVVTSIFGRFGSSRTGVASHRGRVNRFASSLARDDGVVRVGDSRATARNGEPRRDAIARNRVVGGGVGGSSRWSSERLRDYHDNEHWERRVESTFAPVRARRFAEGRGR